MAKHTPWTKLRRRLEPLAAALDRSAPWRVESPQTVSDWLKELPYIELVIGDSVCRRLIQRHAEPVGDFPLWLFDECKDQETTDRWQIEGSRQLMHRFMFAFDLSRRMPPAFRRSCSLNGEFIHDAEEVLIRAWRDGAPLYWAMHFGPKYCAGGA